AMSALAASLALQAQYFSHTVDPSARESQFQEARRLALATKLIDPDNASVYTALAMYAEAHDDYPAQLQASETFLALAPKEPAAHNLLGHTLALGGQWERARELLLKGIALDPKHPIDQLPFNLGWTSFLLRDDEASIAYFKKVVENNPTFFDAYGWIAMAYARKGDMARSKEAADALMKVDPKRSFQTRRHPMPSAPPAYKQFYDEIYLPLGRKAGVVSTNLTQELVHLGRLVARLRQARQVKQADAALRAGLSRNTAYRLEKGDPGLAIGQVLRYLDAIAPGATLADLLTQADPALTALQARESTKRVRDLSAAELDDLNF
ncbi:MAG: hypothetical protein Q7U75_09665, partial [Desulfobacterales bacterium]|nr:hypothetical protein [Desulfobacterales bacterium]